MGFVGTATALVIVTVGLVALIRKNLEQRSRSRRFRDTFIREANALVANPQFPIGHAHQMIALASFPQGWITRLVVLTLGKRLVWRQKAAVKQSAFPRLGEVPEQLRRQYVVAMLSFILSDSYRCVIFGHILRAAHGWLLDAVKEPTDDVDAHATRQIIEQVSQARAPKPPFTHELVAA